MRVPLEALLGLLPPAGAGPSLSCPGGLPGLLPEAFFETLGVFQAFYIRDSLDRSREFLYTLYLPKIAPHLADCFARCPAPTLEIMMNSVLALEADYCPEEARELFERTMTLAAGAADAEPAVGVLLEGWAVDTAHIYPSLLGMVERPCYGSSIKIFVYEVPENFTRPALHCANGQWGTEVLFHRFFLNSECRTMDPNEADFFYVPVYSTCLFVQDGLANVTGAAAEQIWDPLVWFLSSTPWFARRNQRDHIFLFADGQSARIWDSHDLIRSEAVLMMVESKCPTWNEPVRRYTDIKPCHSGWKDILIPGHTDHARASRMRRFNLPTEQRDLLMTFHGRSPDNHEVYKNCAIRERVVALADRDGVDVGGFVEDHLERKGRSHFCLVPGGTSPWTNHLYESFFGGCIPVILSDEYEVAFQHLLEWPRFSIKWPEQAADARLYDFLRAFTAPRLQALKAEVDRHACWFDYASEDRGCSPYLAAVRALEERRDRFPPSAGRFWNAGPALEATEPPRRTTRFHAAEDEPFLL